jgi:hypothetical protein
MSEPAGTAIDQIPFASILNDSCTIANAASSGTDGTTPQGIAAAGNHAYAVDTSGGTDFIEDYTLPALTNSVSNAINSGASFGTQAVAVALGGGDGYIQFGEKKQVDILPFGSASGSEAALAGMTDAYPGGLTVDSSGNVYANDTNTTTYTPNGGIDVFSANLTKTNTVQLGSALSQSGPSGALENIAVGPYGTSNAIYAVTGAGIEVFAFPLATAVAAPTKTITLPATPVSIVTAQDGREWVLLTDGTIDALPPM